MQPDDCAALRLEVLAEPDPGALVRVLHLLQGRNIVPLQVLARRTADQRLAIEIAVSRTDLAADAFDLIVHKLAQLPFVMTAAAGRPDAAPRAPEPATCAVVDDPWR